MERLLSLGLTERERQILRLHSDGLNDYRIAKTLKMETPELFFVFFASMGVLGSLISIFHSGDHHVYCCMSTNPC